MRLLPLLITFSFFFSPFSSSSQLNMMLHDSMDYNSGVNDVCGWAAPDGREYALVGLSSGVSIVNVDSLPIKEVVFVPGVENLWRDINTYSHYAYVSSEARVGLLIIDLQYLPDSVQTYIWKDSLPTMDGPKAFEKAHTLWTDQEDGLLLLNGSNLNSGGVVICDIATDPTDPIFLGYAPARYSHDCYTRDHIIYSAEIYAGDLSIYDANDPQNVQLIGRVKTPYEFTHNAWLSDNGQYMFTTDERANSYVTSYDISDPGNIIELDRYRQASTEGLGNVPHNVYVWNDWVIVAYYANGTTIVDGSRPDNLIEVGNFDSFLGADGGFPGVWGSYPWLPSGKILSSDRNNGLFVFVPNYVRGCYLEGIVIDSVTREPLFDATIRIESPEIVSPTASRLDGSFKMGKAVPGMYSVTVSRSGYFDKTIMLNFENGVVLDPTIELLPYPSHILSGKVVDENDNPIPNALVLVSGINGVYKTNGDAQGQFLIPAVYEGTYDVQAGLWGYVHESQVDFFSAQDLTLVAYRGYKDDFDLDLGWTVSGDATSGIWIREMPGEQVLFDTWLCGSAGDSPIDLGPYAYSTGASASNDPTDDEVNGGSTWLSSPSMDLTFAHNARITFDYWLCEFPPNQYDGLYVWLTNGVDTVMLDHLSNDTITGSWQSKLYDQLPLTPPLQQVKFLISAEDTTTGPTLYVLNAHFDNFELVADGLSVEDQQRDEFVWRLYPNPVTDQRVFIDFPAEMKSSNLNIRISDLQGRILFSKNQISSAYDEGIPIHLPHGLYLLHWQIPTGVSGVAKLIVINE